METIKLDLIPGKKMPSLHASQYDDGRTHGIDLFENGIAYKLDGTETLTINERKVDNNICSMDIENAFESSNHIEFASFLQMCACAGSNFCELRISKGSVDIGTLNFILEIEPDPTADGIESESEIRNLKSQVSAMVDDDLDERLENYATKNDVDEAIDEITPDIKQTQTLLGSNSFTSERDSLSANAVLNIVEAPWFIKKNIGITARMFFDSFTSITVGKGYEKYRGNWVVIDSSNITPYYFDGSTTTAGTPIPHGLTINNYLMVSAYMGEDGRLQLAINTTSGTLETVINYSYEWNYEPFLFGNQDMSNVKLSCACYDLRCPLWIFGDSYMGISPIRIGGPLRDLGYFNYCINSIAGARAEDSSVPGKSSYDDLLRMLRVSTPKFIVWADGMNGGDNANIEFLPTLISLCEQKKIELILYMPPCVPSINHTSLNEYIRQTGLRFIDGNKAVGATPEGVWYNGYLSEDNIHPTALGAKALAERFLADCPELVQYGKTVEVDLSNYYTKTEENALLADKADKYNPTFTGSMSMYRKSGTTVGTRSIALGNSTTSSGTDSFASGSSTIASNQASHAEGYKSESSARFSHAEGRETLASGENSHAEGYNTTSSALNSHAEGYNNTASGNSAHAEGYNNTASGSYSHAEGQGTTSNHRSQHVFGEFNALDESTAASTQKGNYVEIVGNGTSNDSRSNARKLDWQGNETLAGNLIFNGNTSLESELSNRYTKAQVDAIVEAAIDSVLPTDRSSGAIANFKTSLAKPVEIEAEFGADAGGIDEVTIYHRGKNLFDKDSGNVVAGTISSTAFSTGTPTARTAYLPIKGGEKYTVSKIQSTRFTIATSTDIPSSGQALSQRVQNNSQTALSITADANDRYLWIYYYLEGTDTETESNIRNSIQVELGSDATAFEAFNAESNTTTISLGSTYYNGGTLAQDKAGHRSVTADGVTTSLPDGTPKNALIGTNTIWADTGDIDVSFKCRVEDYVDAHSGGGGLRSLGNSNEILSKGGGEEEPEEPISKK